MKKANIIKQKNNFINEIFILKVFENNKFKFNFIGTKNNLINFMTKNLNIKLSENILLSKIFLNDLIDIKIKNNDYIIL